MTADGDGESIDSIYDESIHPKSPSHISNSTQDNAPLVSGNDKVINDKQMDIPAHLSDSLEHIILHQTLLP